MTTSTSELDALFPAVEYLKGIVTPRFFQTIAGTVYPSIWGAFAHLLPRVSEPFTRGGRWV